MINLLYVLHFPKDDAWSFNNYHILQVTDVTSADFRCYDSQDLQSATTITVAAGSQLGLAADSVLYHPGVSECVIYQTSAP